jgi:cell division protein FtsA
MPRSMIVSIIRPRLEKTFKMVRDRIENSGLGHAASGRVVLTGGASQLVAWHRWRSRFSTARCS